MKSMAKKLLSACFAAAAIAGLVSCANTPSPPVEGLVSLTGAMAEITAAVEGRVARGAETGIAEIDAPQPQIGDFFYDELVNSLSAGGKVAVLTRGRDIQKLNNEQQFQISGLVSDESAVGIGHYLGAKVMITASFNRFAGFSQLSVRVLDVETGAVLATSRPRIRNSDPVLAGVTASLHNSGAAVSEEALNWLNRGKDFSAQKLWDDAVYAFGRAIAINRDLADAYAERGFAYFKKDKASRGIADMTRAIKLDPDNARYYDWRSMGYAGKSNWKRFIADVDQAIRLMPDNAEYYQRRGVFYGGILSNYDRAIENFTQAIRLDPGNSMNYLELGRIYRREKGNSGMALNVYLQGIDYYTKAIEIDPDNKNNYRFRGGLYKAAGDIDKNNAFQNLLNAYFDYTKAIQLDPYDAYCYAYRGDVQRLLLQEEEAIADCTRAVELDPNNWIMYSTRAGVYEYFHDERASADRAMERKLRGW
jgi:tetratricopeptide (TPR) repeat protein